MKKRAAFALGAALAVSLCVLWVGGRAVADGPDQQQPAKDNVPLAVTVPWKISYQGRLTDSGGNPLNGNYQVVLELWTAASGGDMLDSTTQMVSVENGLFSTWFSVNPYERFKGQARWLSIAVEGQPVAPRQEILAVPYAWCALGGLGFPFDGVSYDSSAPAFSITYAAGAGMAIRGIATNTGDVINYGGYFEAYGTQGRAVAGAVSGDNARGVYGYAVSGAASVGVYGESTYGPGGFFTSQNDHLDLTLGGAVGRINTDPADQNSVLILSSNHDVVVKLDNDGGEESVFRIKNSGGTDVLTVDETGTLTVKVLEITGGADLSEEFEIRGTDAISRPRPGMVVSIDGQNPGDLMVSDRAYDRRVAGVVSGAGGVKPAMLMGQKGSKADGSNPVALTGRVYCWADASNGEIAPGDLLTTSDAPGHAMKVTDYARAQGAILGKAMTGLSEGKGLVLVLVALQ